MVDGSNESSKDQYCTIDNYPIDNEMEFKTYLDYSCLFPKNSKLVECTKVNTNTHGYALVTPTSVKI